MHPLRSFSKLIQFSLLAETISFSLLHLLIPNGGFLFTPHLLHTACQKSLSSPSSPHFPFDSSFILKVSGREHPLQPPWSWLGRAGDAGINSRRTCAIPASASRPAKGHRRVPG